MINVSAAWHRALSADKRDFLERVTIALKDNTVLNLTNENIWQGGFSIDDAVSADSDFQIGAAIVNKFTLTINNIYETYSSYVFENALVRVQIGLETDESTEYIDKGRYIVNKATYNGSLINLECYDYMVKFDVPYNDPVSGSTLVYPNTLQNIILDACSKCGNITLRTTGFPHSNFMINDRPSDESTTYREVIAWCAQIAGCFARMNNVGELTISWYPQSALEDFTSDNLDGGVFDSSTPYQSGDSADGGSFNPWDDTGDVYDAGTFASADDVHVISSLYNSEFSFDPVIITGVRILVKTEIQNEPIKEHSTGTEGYVVEIQNNPMITEDNYSSILAWLGTQLIGFRFYRANVSHGSDPSIEAGDVALVFDGRGRGYPVVISRTTFSFGSPQTLISSAQNTLRNSVSRFSAETKNYVQMRRNIDDLHSELEDIIAESSGLYETVITDSTTGASVYYLHNKPNPNQTIQGLSESDIQIRFSDAGITVTADGGTTWYGLTATGDMFVNLLSARRILVEDGSGYKLRLTSTGAYIIDPSNNVVSEYSTFVRLISSDAISMLQLENSGVSVYRAKTGETLSDAKSGIKLGTTQGRANIMFDLGTVPYAHATYTIDTDYTVDYSTLRVFIGADYDEVSYVMTDSTHFTVNASSSIGEEIRASADVTDYVGFFLSLGENNTSGAVCTLAVGDGVSATGNYAVAFGDSCVASGNHSFASGRGCTADSANSHAEGENCYAGADGSHAEGQKSTTMWDAPYSHAEGYSTHASNKYAHSEGYDTTADGLASHAGGKESWSMGDYCFVHGLGLKNYYAYRTVVGKYNYTGNDRTIDPATLGNYGFVVGGGSSDSSRSDAMKVRYNGNVEISGTLTQSSDKRLKEHISYLSDDAVEFIDSLKPAHFKMNDEDHVGFYAQDVEESDKWNSMVGEMNGYKTLGYTEIIAPLVAYCQKLEERIANLEKQIQKEGD